MTQSLYSSIHVFLSLFAFNLPLVPTPSYSPFVARVGQGAVDGDHVGDVLVEGVVLPPFVHLLLGLGIEVLREHHGLAHFPGAVGLLGRQEDALLGVHLLGRKREERGLSQKELPSLSF